MRNFERMLPLTFSCKELGCHGLHKWPEESCPPKLRFCASGKCRGHHSPIERCMPDLYFCGHPQCKGFHSSLGERCF